MTIIFIKIIIYIGFNFILLHIAIKLFLLLFRVVERVLIINLFIFIRSVISILLNFYQNTDYYFVLNTYYQFIFSTEIGNSKSNIITITNTFHYFFKTIHIIFVIAYF